VINFYVISYIRLYNAYNTCYQDGITYRFEISHFHVVPAQARPKIPLVKREALVWGFISGSTLEPRLKGFHRRGH
jgi:hypothetical protein